MPRKTKKTKKQKAHRNEYNRNDITGGSFLPSFLKPSNYIQNIPQYVSDASWKMGIYKD